LAQNVERIEKKGNEYKILVGEPDWMKGDIELDYEGCKRLRSGFSCTRVGNCEYKNDSLVLMNSWAFLHWEFESHTCVLFAF
jgi:hypothetical protein